MEEGYYWDLINKHLSGKTTSSEEQALKGWISQREENHDFFELQKALWLGTPQTPADFKTVPQWELLKSRIQEHEFKKNQGYQMSVYLKIAASILFFIGMGACIKYLVLDSTNLIVTTAPADHKIEVILPDKSKVWLSKNSTLEYPEEFDGNQRKVSLQGEAFFEIRKDTLKPFVIVAAETFTQVLGTSFNIRALDSENKVVVTVVTGKVAFYSTESDQKLTLQPGNTGVYTKGNQDLQKITATNENFMAWQTGILIFKNTPLKEVIRMLNQHYGNEIIVSNDLLNSCKITTQLKNQSLDNVLRELEILLPIEYTNEKGKIVISGESCY